MGSINQNTFLYTAPCVASESKAHIPGGPKSDTPFNYVKIMPYKLQNNAYLYCFNNFNIYY